MGNNDESTRRKLTFVNPLSLAGSGVVARYGLEGVEPDEVVEASRGNAALGRLRLCFAINGYYPTLSRGPYDNRAVQLLIQLALRGAGFHAATQEEIYEDAACPDELEGFLHEFDTYSLVLGGQVIGEVVVWSCSNADLSEYYEGNLLFDVHARPDLCELIYESVEDACNTAQITFTRQADVNWQPRPRSLLRFLPWGRS